MPGTDKPTPSAAQAAPVAAAAADEEKTIALDTPLQRGATQITQVSLRKPLTGQLTGIKLFELLSMDVGSLCQLLPRITTPSLLAHEVKQLDPADLTEMGAAVAGFFVKKSSREESLAA